MNEDNYKNVDEYLDSFQENTNIVRVKPNQDYSEDQVLSRAEPRIQSQLEIIKNLQDIISQLLKQNADLKAEINDLRLDNELMEKHLKPSDPDEYEWKPEWKPEWKRKAHE